jgi:CubicO group peptidase (beta-lactamase class C family)
MGEIDLTKPIGTYLGRFVSTPNDEITSQPISAFLNHSTGLPSNNLRAVTSGLTTWQQYADFAARGTVSRSPGRYLYSNDNYVLLTKLVVDVTDLPFSVAVRKLVWEPLGVAGGGLDVSTRGTQVLGGAGAWVTAPYAVALLLDALNPETNGTKLLSKPWLARMHGVTPGLCTRCVRPRLLQRAEPSMWFCRKVRDQSHPKNSSTPWPDWVDGWLG